MLLFSLCLIHIEKIKRRIATIRNGRKIVYQLPGTPALDRTISTIAYIAKVSGGAKARALIEVCLAAFIKRKPGAYRMKTVANIATKKLNQIIILSSFFTNY